MRSGLLNSFLKPHQPCFVALNFACSGTTRCSASDPYYQPNQALKLLSLLAHEKLVVKCSRVGPHRSVFTIQHYSVQRAPEGRACTPQSLLSDVRAANSASFIRHASFVMFQSMVFFVRTEKDIFLSRACELS